LSLLLLLLLLRKRLSVSLIHLEKRREGQDRTGQDVRLSNASEVGDLSRPDA